jgi:general secretion pathway protein L
MAPTTIDSGLSRFLSWWGQELYGLLPGSRPTPESASARVTLAVEPTGLRLIEAGGGKSVNTKFRGAPAPNGVVPVPAMMAYLASLSRIKKSPTTISLRLPFSACFVRRTELPAGAQRDFARLLALDLERSTPFKTKDVLTTYTVDGAPTAKGLLKVRHLIIKRKSVEGLTADIEALGLKVTRIECLTEDGAACFPTNFLASSATPGATARPIGIATTLLALGVAALAASATYTYIDHHAQALTRLQAETTRLKAISQSQKDALAKTQSAFTEIANYQKLRAETVSKVTVIEELSRILPDTAWITDLKLDGSTLDISGLATSAAALVPILERSRTFVDATSTASLTFDPREEKERYSIRARIRSISTEQPRPTEAAVPPAVEGAPRPAETIR